jgi:hypothetical protein
MNPEMKPIPIKKCLAIVMFGPATLTSGTRPGEYYTVTIDPAKRSPSGEFIRLGLHKGDEINGWQRVAALTVVEVLAEFEDEAPETIPENTSPLTMRAVSV